MLRTALLLVAALTAPVAAQPPVPRSLPAEPAPLLGQPPAGIPNGPPPAGFRGPPLRSGLMIVKVDQGKLIITDTVMVAVPRQIEGEVKTPDGKVVKIVKTVTVTEMQPITRVMPLEGVKAMTAAGKAVPADKLADLLKDDTVVMLGHVPLSEKLRKALKDDVLCLTMPREPAGGVRKEPRQTPPPPPPPPPAPPPVGAPRSQP